MRYSKLKSSFSEFTKKPQLSLGVSCLSLAISLLSVSSNYNFEENVQQVIEKNTKLRDYLAKELNNKTSLDSRQCKPFEHIDNATTQKCTAIIHISSKPTMTEHNLDTYFKGYFKNKGDLSYLSFSHEQGRVMLFSKYNAFVVEYLALSGEKEAPDA